MLPFLKPSTLLRFLILLDALIGAWALAMPKLWFWVFHGQSVPDANGLLHRAAAQWVTYLVLQAIALWRWKKEPVWLAIVAGCRLSDVLTDLAVVASASHLTWIGYAAFSLAGPANLVFGIALLGAIPEKAGASPTH